MSGFAAFVGASIGGWVGWSLGSHVGLMTAWTASVFGTAVGVYVGRWVVDEYLS